MRSVALGCACMAADCCSNGWERRVAERVCSVRERSLANTWSLSLGFFSFLCLFITLMKLTLSVGF